MASLSGKAPATTFKDLLTVYDGDDNEGLEGTLKTVFDGDGVAAPIQLSTTSMNISSHDGSSNGLQLNGTLVLATAAEINQIDGVTFGGSSNTDVLTIAGTQSIINKTIDGGDYS